jgi:very-short-patch-repair endonuclease
MFNPRLYLNGRFLASPDAWWPAAGVVVEVDSMEWHLSPEDWQDTMRRHDRMTAAGILVLHVTPRQLRAEEARIARDIAAALATGRPPAGVTAEAAAA